MEKLMTIDLSHAAVLYPLFYQISFLVAFLIFIAFGVRKKYPMYDWILIGTSATLFSILGSRIGTYDWKEWLEMISTGNLTAHHSKTSIGAILLGLIGIFLAKKMLNFRQPILPVYAIVIPVALFFQRVACLSAGCCFGLPTDASFGIQYQGFSFIRDRHVETGLIKFNEMTSHAVHPVPVYFMLAYALSILAFLYFRKKVRQPGSLLFIVIAVIFFSRFFIEFFRDPATNHSLGEHFWGLKMVQWVVLGVAAVSSFSAFLMEKYAGKKQDEKPKTGAVSFRPVFFALLLTALIFHFQKNLTTPELVVLQLKLILAWAALLYAVAKVPSPKKLKPVVPAALFLSLLLMSQALPEKIKDPLPRFQHNFSVSSTSANIGVTGYKCIKVEQGCYGGNYCALADTAHAIGPAYQNINLGYDFLGQITERSSLAFSLGYRFDRFYNERANFTSNSKHFFFSTGLEGRKHIGFRLGIRVGDIFFYEEDGKNRFFKKAVGMGSIWFGHKDYLTGHFGFSDGPMNITPAVSSGYLKANLKMLGTKYPDQLIFGNSGFSEGFSTTYVGLEKYIGPHFRIEPYYGWTGGVDKSQRHNFQLKLSYQFFKK